MTFGFNICISVFRKKKNTQSVWYPIIHREFPEDAKDMGDY